MPGTPIPAALNDVTIERVIKIDSSLLYLIDGALAFLADIEPLVATGALTVDEVRLLLSDMLWCYLTGDCSDENIDSLIIQQMDDNAYMFDGDVFTEGNIYVGQVANNHAGLRYSNPTIPPATELISATLILRPADDNVGAPFSITIRGVADDNPPAWSDSYKPYPQTYVTPTTVITPASWTDGVDVELDVTATVQSIIDRAGYSLGSAISLTIIGTATGGSYMSIIGYDTSTVNCARLKLVY